MGLQKWLLMSPNSFLLHLTRKESWKNGSGVKMCVLTILNWFLILETSEVVKGLHLSSWQMQTWFSLFALTSRLPLALRGAAASPAKRGWKSRSLTTCLDSSYTLELMRQPLGVGRSAHSLISCFYSFCLWGERKKLGCEEKFHLLYNLVFRVANPSSLAQE